MTRVLLCVAVWVSIAAAMAQVDDATGCLPPICVGPVCEGTEYPEPFECPDDDLTVCTCPVLLELPTEIEIELGMDSLKQAALFNELSGMLEDPYAFVCPGREPTLCYSTTERRPSFLPHGCTYVPGMGLPMCDDSLQPALRVWNPGFNVLTGEPLRLKVAGGEIDWSIPGPLFGPDDGDPFTMLPVIGQLRAVRTGERTPTGHRLSNLVVSNPDGNPLLPQNGTVVAVPGVNSAGRLIDIDGNVIDELEAPVNENHFVGNRLRAEELGKALFWDMQVGSDGIQACGSCHFHAGVDNRTKNQLNPNTTGPDGDASSLDVRGPNMHVLATDFPFHSLANPSMPGEPLFNPANVTSDADDVMSSMGVSRFERFLDVKVGAGAFIPGTEPPVLQPDDGDEAEPEPVAAMIDGDGTKLRRVEARHTPTFHAAAFNFDNFWDGRARHDFNGGSVFGATDPFYHVYVNPPGDTLKPMSNPENDAQLDDGIATWFGGEAPVRIRFCSMASQAMGPPLSEFEMAFIGRNWQKIGKKMLQDGVTPLAKQLVDVTDSRLGIWSNQGGLQCIALGRPTAPGKPGLCTTYREMIMAAFPDVLWNNTDEHLVGTAVPMNSDCDPGEQIEMGVTPTCDPFDGFVVDIAGGPADPTDTNHFTQMEANFSLFFGLSVQLYQQLTIPDDTPFDRFLDANPQIGDAIAQPGERFNLLPDEIPPIRLVEGFGPEAALGFDIFMNANTTKGIGLDNANNAFLGGAGGTAAWRAAFPDGRNPNFRSARCGNCHVGPEQSDHTTNISAGLLQSPTEYELPIPPTAAEATGTLRTVTGFFLAEELEENTQDAVEVENRNMAALDDPTTPDVDERVIAAPSAQTFLDNGIYNIGLRPVEDDLGRGDDDPFGFPLSLAALALMNLSGEDYVPCDEPGQMGCIPEMLNFDPLEGVGGGLFEETTDMSTAAGLAYQMINPGLEVEPAMPMLPEYLAEWANNLPAGEAHPEIDELAFAPNTVTEPPVAEFTEILSQTDVNCAVYDPATRTWGPQCPTPQSGNPNNFPPTLNGTWPFPNRVARKGHFKVPHLRNVELTGPYFHTGSYLTLRQVVDFYVRGGDFPMTNAEHRDPDIVNIDFQAFGFGANEFTDAENQYPALSGPEREERKEALVHFMLALTDERVAKRQAPFDQPEIFPPVDGTAPENTGGRAELLADSRFLRVPATGAGGQAARLEPFLVSSTPAPGDNNDHFDRDPGHSGAIQVCGDGTLDPVEVCDDGNTVGGDGCSANCCSDETCGNGLIDTITAGPGEECDDGNNANDDGCSAICRVECGDGNLNPDEECDDGNTVGGDGCQANCLLPLCGDGIVDPNEDCDDGNNMDGDGCQANCRHPVCGDGIVDPGEQCDDGNTAPDDGCSATCQSEGPVARLEAGTVTGVGVAAKTVQLANTYISPVVVCAVHFPNNAVPPRPVVARVKNVTSNSFDVRLQAAANGPPSAYDVSYIVVEAGNWTIDGVSIEAQRYLSTVTDDNNSWTGQAQTYLGSYTAPVVLGQVMTENDPRWSVFWSSNGIRTSQPSPSSIWTGKHVGEDPVSTRANETVGFIVIETGHGFIGGVEYEARVGADSVKGVGNIPPYAYRFSTPFLMTPTVLIPIQTAMDGVQGGWAQTHGTPATAATLFLSIDEDTLQDGERAHTTEQIAYVAFASPVIHSASVAARRLQTPETAGRVEAGRR